MNKKLSPEEIQQLIDNARRNSGRPQSPELPPADNQHSATLRPLHSWDAPDWSILDDRRGELPDFPLDCLGKPLRAWVERAAAGAGVTAAHVAVPALGIASGLIGMACRVRACSSWLEPMTCWAGIVGASGTGKTPGIDAIKRALDQIERDNQSKVSGLQREHESRVENARAARAHWKKQVEDAVEAGVTPPPMPEEATDLGKFVAPRPYVSDGTIERFGELLQARPQGVLRLTDELSAMFMNMSRYSGGQDNEFWLESWNGNSYNVERIGRTLHLDHLLIGVVGGLQPDKLAKSFEGPADGMYARVLFSWPSEPAYRKLNDEALEVDPDILNALKRLDGLAEFADGRLVRRSIELTKDALAKFEQFRQFVHAEKEAVEGRDREWLAKAPAHVLRLAGTLCLLDWAMLGGEQPTGIGVGPMAAAIRLVREYFWPHARASLRQIGLTERHVNARRVLCWIRARRKNEISLENVRRDALGQKLDAEQTAALLEMLARSGWVRELSAFSTPKGGRPLRRWQVNPQIGVPVAETAETAQTPLQPEVSAVSAVSASQSVFTANGGADPLPEEGGDDLDDGLGDGAARQAQQTSENGGFSVAETAESNRDSAATSATNGGNVADVALEAGNGGDANNLRCCDHCGQPGTAANPLHHGYWRRGKPEGAWLHTGCKHPYQAGGMEKEKNR